MQFMPFLKTVGVTLTRTAGKTCCREPWGTQVIMGVHQQPEALHWWPGALHQWLGVLYQQPGVPHQQPGALHQQPEALHKQPEALYEWPEVLHQCCTDNHCCVNKHCNCTSADQATGWAMHMSDQEPAPVMRSPDCNHCHVDKYHWDCTLYVQYLVHFPLPHTMHLPSYMDCCFLATPAITATLLACLLCCPNYFSCCACLYIANWNVNNGLKLEYGCR